MNLLTSRLRWLALAAVAIVTIALSACTTTGPDPGPDPGDNNTASSMLTRINNFRTTSGAVALTSDTTLNTIAQAQADYNAEHAINTEVNGAGETLGDQMLGAGYQFATYASLFNNQGESASFNEWKNNSSFSGIMLDPTFEDIGIGTAQVSGGLRRWVVVFAVKNNPTNNTVQEMLDLLNAKRTDNSAAALTLNENLSIVAQEQAEHNAANEELVDSIGGVGMEDRVTATGYDYGEILFTLANGSAASTVDRWTDTPAELNQILDDSFEDVGIGVATGGSRQWWVVIYAESVP